MARWRLYGRDPLTALALLGVERVKLTVVRLIAADPLIGDMLAAGSLREQAKLLGVAATAGTHLVAVHDEDDGFLRDGNVVGPESIIEDVEAGLRSGQ